MSLNDYMKMADGIAERVDSLGPITVRRFFGMAGLWAQNVLFGFVVYDALYLRSDGSMRQEPGELGSTPFEYQKSASIVTIAKYWSLPQSLAGDDGELSSWCERAYSVAASSPKPKRRRNRLSAREW